MPNQVNIAEAKNRLNKACHSGDLLPSDLDIIALLADHARLEKLFKKCKEWQRLKLVSGDEAFWETCNKLDDAIDVAEKERA